MLINVNIINTNLFSKYMVLSFKNTSFLSKVCRIFIRVFMYIIFLIGFLDFNIFGRSVNVLKNSFIFNINKSNERSFPTCSCTNFVNNQTSTLTDCRDLSVNATVYRICNILINFQAGLLSRGYFEQIIDHSRLRRITHKISTRHMNLSSKWGFL